MHPCIPTCPLLLTGSARNGFRLFTRDRLRDGDRIAHLLESLLGDPEEILDVLAGDDAEVAKPESFQPEHLSRIDGEAPFVAVVMQLEEIEHRTTQVRRPQSNGIAERLHRTLLDEHFRIMGRTKFYESVEEMQTDLDIFLDSYNQERPHQGRNMNGRTPLQAFLEGLPEHPEKEVEAVG